MRRYSSGVIYRKLSIVLILGVVTLVLYGRVSRYTFLNYDDDLYVTPRILSGLSWENLAWAFHNVHANFWHPLTTLSLMLDAELFGRWPGGYHLSNVMLHIANSILLFAVLQKMTGALWRSAIVAALFAWHPLHVESVAWISARKDVLSTFFMLVTLLAYVRYVRRRSIANYLLVTVSFLVGLMAKPMLVTLPFLLLLLDYWPLQRMALNRETNRKTQSNVLLITEKFPLIALSIVFSVIAFVAQGEAVVAVQDVPVWARIFNIPLSYARYIAKTFWPLKLAPIYPYSREFALMNVLAAAFLIALVTVAVIWSRKRHPYLIVGWLWFMGTLVPVLGIIQVGVYLMADRFTYVPLIGLFIMIVWGISEAFNAARFRIPARVAITCSALLACVWLTHLQLFHWKDSITLFTHTLKVTRDNWIAHINLGADLLRQGRIDEGVGHYRAALNIYPHAFLAHMSLGNIMLERRQIDEAGRHFSHAVWVQPRNPTAHANLGVAYALKGRMKDAIRHFRESLEMDPHNPRVRENLRKALVKQNEQAADEP